MGVERREHNSSTDAEQFALNAVKDAVVGGHWMAVVWSVADGKLELTRCTTFQFPKAEFAAALGQLSLRLADEAQRASAPPVPDPLPDGVLQGLAEKVAGGPVKVLRQPIDDSDELPIEEDEDEEMSEEGDVE